MPGGGCETVDLFKQSCHSIGLGGLRYYVCGVGMISAGDELYEGSDTTPIPRISTGVSLRVNLWTLFSEAS